MLFSTVAIAAFASLAAAVPVKRGFSGKATYYATGLGACGEVNVDSDFIVALNSPQFGGGYPGPNCFKQVQINANGKSAVATIMDQCPGCAYGSLDLSPSLFSHFADHSVGVFQMDWDFTDGNSAPAPAPVVEEPKTSSTPEPTPSSTWVVPSSTYVAPTSTYVEPSSTYVAPTTSETPSSTSVAPTTSSAPAVVAKIESTAEASSSSVWSASASSSVPSSVATSASSASTESASTSATSTSSAPVPTITVDLAGGNLAQLCEAVAQMGKLVVVGASLANGTEVALSNTTATVTFA